MMHLLFIILVAGFVVWGIFRPEVPVHQTFKMLFAGVVFLAVLWFACKTFGLFDDSFWRANPRGR